MLSVLFVSTGGSHPGNRVRVGNPPSIRTTQWSRLDRPRRGATAHERGRARKAEPMRRGPIAGQESQAEELLFVPAVRPRIRTHISMRSVITEPRKIKLIQSKSIKKAAEKTKKTKRENQEDLNFFSSQT